MQQLQLRSRPLEAHNSDYGIPSSGSPISKLPAEILGSIFQELYYSSRQKNLMWPSFPGKWEWHDKDLHTPNLFPITLASVCHHWRDVSKTHQCFWTRLVFIMDDKVPLPLDAFNWSGPTAELDVLCLTHKQGQNRGTDETGEVKTIEREWVASMATYILPYLHRCRSIEFDAEYSSSLPAPTFFFDTNNTCLTSIALNCNIDDGLPVGIPIIAKNLSSRNKCSNLASLVLPCRFLMEIFRQHPQSLTGVCYLSLTLTRHCFHAARDPTLFSFETLLYHILRLGRLLSLNFKHISLAYQSRYIHSSDSEFGHSGVHDCSFEDVDPNLITTFFDITSYLHWQSISFMRCSIPRFTAPVGSDFLHLEDIQDEPSFYNVFDAWDTPQLTIKRCPAFNDALIHWLACRGETGLHSFPGLRVLTIVDCFDFSAKALASWLRSRYDPLEVSPPAEDVYEGEWDTHDTVPLHNLYVEGRVPTLSNDEMEEFRGRPIARWVLWKGLDSIVFSTWLWSSLF